LIAAMVLGANHPIGPLALADMVGLDTLCLSWKGFIRNWRRQIPPRPFASQKWCAPDTWDGKAGRAFNDYSKR